MAGIIPAFPGAGNSEESISSISGMPAIHRAATVREREGLRVRADRSLTLAAPWKEPA
jgi:hypothetical protein